MFDNFEFKKCYGQNFIHDTNIINKIVNESKVDGETFVIEIGPGAGSLSKCLVPKSQYCLLYEIDPRLKERLDFILRDYDNYEIIFNDFLKCNVKEKLKDYNFKKLYVVANLPYYITTPIITKLVDDDILPDKIVIMVQKEVGDRLSAKVGDRDYGSLTVVLNYNYEIKKLFDVSRNCFTPKPNVDSVVVEMKKISNINNVKNIKFFRKFVRDSFQFKRKNLRNNLKNYDLNSIESILNKYNLDLNCRAENLSLDIFIDICNELCD